MNERELSEQFTDPIPGPERELAKYVEDYTSSYDAVFANLTNLADYGDAALGYPSDIAHTLLQDADSAADAFTAISSVILEQNSLLTAVDDWVGFASLALADLDTSTFTATRQSLPAISREELAQYAVDYIRNGFPSDSEPKENWIVDGYSELLKNLVADILDRQQNYAVLAAYGVARSEEADKLKYTELQGAIGNVLYDTHDLTKTKDFLGRAQNSLKGKSKLYSTYIQRFMNLHLLEETIIETGKATPESIENTAFTQGFVMATAITSRLLSHKDQPIDTEQLDKLEPEVLLLFNELASGIKQGKSLDVALMDYQFAITNQPQLYDFADLAAKGLYGLPPGQFSQQSGIDIGHFHKGFAVGYELFAEHQKIEKEFAEIYAIFDGGEQ